MCTPTAGSESEPILQDVSPPRTWNAARDVINAPTTGLALLASRSVGMRECAGPPLTVTFWQPPRVSGGGSTVGDVFVAWMPNPPGVFKSPPGRPWFRAVRRRAGVASAGRTGVRPIRSQHLVHAGQRGRARSARVPAHRPMGRAHPHWRPSGVSHGLLRRRRVLPVLRNHFERAASLDDGGYPAPPDNKPAPLPGAVAAIGAVLLLMLRRRIRWLTRLLVAGRAGATAHLPGRCPVHATGWFRQPAQHSRRPPT